MPDGTVTPIYTYDIQYYIDISDTAGGASPTPNFANVTEDTAFDPSREYSTYSPSYKDREVQPEYDTSSKYGIAMDVDIFENQAFQEWLVAHEDDKNVPTSIVRVWAKKGTEQARPAKMAAFGLTMDPLDGPAGEFLKGKGKLKMTSNGWTAGTFNETTKVFTATEG
ncbi:MAG: hypothetical protein LBU48_05640 [Coriobacteriales bacterium]|jgi:hypothetical protein|nr:hypothetical protein [Coriobacteriales bacterium]